MSRIAKVAKVSGLTGMGKLLLTYPWFLSRSSRKTQTVDW
jgi:hypothetical protein